MTDIQAILFDIGGTLRYSVRRTRAEIERILSEMMGIIDASDPVIAFESRLAQRALAYKHWAAQTNIELNERELWTRWMLPDYPAEQVASQAVALNQLYRDSLGQRLPFPDSREIIISLYRRGYRLGVVSNTTSSVEVPGLLRELEIAGMIEVVVLSAVSGTRKPHPAILLEAAQRMGVAPEHCAYVGDRVERDVAAARAAGFARTVIIDPAPGENGSHGGDADSANLSPDYSVSELCAVLEIFPDRPAPRPPVTYNAALSTMYAIQNFPNLGDFFEYARRAGFAHVELNHKVTSAMLEGVPLDGVSIRSVHEPCPADISEAELKKRGWLISAEEEALRVEGVKAIRRSIDLAARVGADVVVIHAGETVPDLEHRERKLRKMLEAGERYSATYQAIFDEMLAIRASAAPAAFDSVRRSLNELLAYAAPRGVRLGLENRYHYLECPSPDELEALLALAGPDRLGFVFDIGHAHALEYLGFYAKDHWLQRFGARIILTHLHDLRGTTDHYAPGLGSADYAGAAQYLPGEAYRTCEIQTFNTPEHVRAALRILAHNGCITAIP